MRSIITITFIICGLCVDAVLTASTVSTKRKYTLATQPSTQNRGGLEENLGVCHTNNWVQEVNLHLNRSLITDIKIQPPLITIGMGSGYGITCYSIRCCGQTLSFRGPSSWTVEQWTFKRESDPSPKWWGGFKNEHGDWPPHFMRTLGLGPGVKRFLIKTLLVQDFAHGYVIAGHVILHGHFF